MAGYNLVKSFEPREYQAAISEKAVGQNTLVVLPTGMGKTLIAVMVGVSRLKKHNGSKILITAPTRPLNAQHTKSFERFTDIPGEEIILITGKSTPKQRAEMYKDATVVAATPQCIKNDIESGILEMEDFSLVVFDEAHRAVKDYAYTQIAKRYMKQAENPLILGLTASPGGNREKIGEITDNLFIKAVDVRGESDDDVKQYVKDIEKEWVYVDFPEEYAKIKSLLESYLNEDLKWLKEKHYLPIDKPNRRMLLMAQQRLGARSVGKNFGNMWAMIRVAEAIKLEHAIELIETQGVEFLNEYFEKLSASKKRTDARMMKSRSVEEAFEIAKSLKGSDHEHPKMTRLVGLVKALMKPDVKIIVFANYRATVECIRKLLEKEGISANEFIGQNTKNGKGMKQLEQIEMLNRFRNGEFSVLVATSVGEEGLDVPAVDYAIFYEPVASEIRSIQRRGRVGRQVAGKVFLLITKGTRDEAYYWAAMNKEKRMKGILEEMKNGKIIRRKKSLVDWTGG